MKPDALLLIAHGSRNPEANADLDFIARKLEAQGHGIVVPAYLELAQPDIAEGGRICVERGAGRVVLVPYFLSAGVHVRCDLTQARADLSQRYPAVTFCLAEPLGRHPLLVHVVEDRFRDALKRIEEPGGR